MTTADAIKQHFETSLMSRVASTTMLDTARKAGYKQRQKDGPNTDIRDPGQYWPTHRQAIREQLAITDRAEVGCYLNNNNRVLCLIKHLRQQ